VEIILIVEIAYSNRIALFGTKKLQIPKRLRSASVLTFLLPVVTVFL
jgi:hypothetical protein